MRKEFFGGGMEVFVISRRWTSDVFILLNNNNCFYKIEYYFYFIKFRRF